MRVLAVLACLATAVGMVAAAPHAHRTGGVASWTPSSFTQSVIMDASFADTKTGFIAGGDNGVGANVLKTTDGGVTFESVPIHPAAMLMAISTASATSAIVSGVGMFAGGVQYTVDGVSFTNSSQPEVSIQESQDASSIAFGTVDGFAVVGHFSFYGTNGSTNGVAISNDGGASFVVNVVDASVSAVPVRYGSFPSAQVGYIAAGDWPSSKQTFGFPLSRNVHIHTDDEKKPRMHFNFDKPESDESNRGWIAGIYKSVDAFQTWSLVFQASDFYFNKISCPNEKVCYAAAENDDFGFGYRTEDGGATWEQVLKEAGVSMFAAHAISADEAYFGGGVLAQTGIIGQIYQTTDAGDSFNNTTLPGYYLTSITFADSDHGFATAMNQQSSCNVLIYA